MQDFANWFCLDNRANFAIDPQIDPQDAKYYFGRPQIKDQLERQIRRAFITPGVPKMVVYGPYGSGKTQTLFHLEYNLKNQPPNSVTGIPHTVYLAVEMRSNSTAAHLHMQMMEALGKTTVAGWIRKLFDETANLDVALKEITEDPNIISALKELRTSGDSTFVAWRWLAGQPLGKNELSGLQLTRNPGDVGASDLVNVIVAVGNLASRIGEKLIFLLDEFEQVRDVKTGDAAESIHQYLRRLSEPVNASLGFIVGVFATVLDEAPEVLRRGDIVSRLKKSNYIELQNLPAVSDVKVFVKELLKNLTNEPMVAQKIADSNLDTEIGTYPFEKLALEALADYATQEPTASLPRNIINAINECAIQAWDEQKMLIDEGIVNSVAPYVF
jgi:hypothetical protein